MCARFSAMRQDVPEFCTRQIHISFDLWTSPNHMSFIGVVGHFINAQYKVESVLLGLRRLRGTHSGENIAEVILKVVRTYELTGDQIGWFVLDNATSNDTCVAEVLKDLSINDTVARRRLRCLGHIINLAAKAFLFGSGDFEKEVERTEEEKKEQEIWRKQGPIGKLHNIVTYIRSTPKRREEFEEKVKEELEKQKSYLAATVQPDEDVELVMKEPLMVIQDNKTRWNSTFCMIQRAFLLKDPLDLFVKRACEKSIEKSPLPKEDELSRNDWNILARARDILQPFFDLTLRLQGRASRATHGSIWEALSALDFLLNELKEKSKEYGAQSREAPIDKRSSRKKGVQKPANNESENAHIASSIDSCWAKLRKYYELMDQSPVYAAAVVLNPQHKWDYFKTNWKEHPDWIANAEESVEELWNTMYKDTEDSSKSKAEYDLNSGLFLPTPRKDPSNFDQWVSASRYARPTVLEQDGYKKYLETVHFPNWPGDFQSISQPKSVDLCAFWARYEAEYPLLARMAFDVLSIPAMSAECERVFSCTKLLLTDQRARMKEDIIEASECLRSWLLAGRNRK